jgi:hypothetical protein
VFRRKLFERKPDVRLWDGPLEREHRTGPANDVHRENLRGEEVLAHDEHLWRSVTCPLRPSVRPAVMGTAVSVRDVPTSVQRGWSASACRTRVSAA